MIFLMVEKKTLNFQSSIHQREGNLILFYSFGGSWLLKNIKGSAFVLIYACVSIYTHGQSLLTKV